VHFYSLRVNAPNGGSPSRVIQLLNNASSQLVVTLLTNTGGGGGGIITASLPLLVTGGGTKRALGTAAPVTVTDVMADVQWSSSGVAQKR